MFTNDTNQGVRNLKSPVVYNKTPILKPQGLKSKIKSSESTTPHSNPSTEDYLKGTNCFIFNWDIVKGKAKVNKRYLAPKISDNKLFRSSSKGKLFKLSENLSIIIPNKRNSKEQANNNLQQNEFDDEFGNLGSVNKKNVIKRPNQKDSNCSIVITSNHGRKISYFTFDPTNTNAPCKVVSTKVSNRKAIMRVFYGLRIAT